MNNKKILENAKKIVEEWMASYWPSHDFFHVMRVYNNALKIYEKEFYSDKSVDLLAIQLWALFHDIADYKYSWNNEASMNITARFMEDNDIDIKTQEKVKTILEYISFWNKLKWWTKIILKELGIVQDADKLDAIWSIGIARTFSYWWEKGIKIFDSKVSKKLNMTKDEYKQFQKEPQKYFTVYNHFYEKLLKLKWYMNTDTWKELAEKRHDFMLKFLDDFDEDVLLNN